jgi:hypothetical protein
MKPDELIALQKFFTEGVADDPALYQDRLTRFNLICDLMASLFELKQAQYGNSTGETGVLGATLEIQQRAARLRAMVLKNPTHGRDQKQAIIDTAHDLHNYANILILMIQEDNWEGYERGAEPYPITERGS